MGSFLIMGLFGLIIASVVAVGTRGHRRIETPVPTALALWHGALYLGSADGRVLRALPR